MMIVSTRLTIDFDEVAVPGTLSVHIVGISAKPIGIVCAVGEKIVTTGGSVDL